MAISVERRVERGTLSEDGSVEVVCGCMFSGKSEELIRRVKREQIALEAKIRKGLLSDEEAKDVIIVFKPRLDNRYGEKTVNSHNGMSLEATPIDEKNPAKAFEHIREKTRVVAFDEVQFFGPQIVEVCDGLADRGCRVIVAGLDKEFRGETFGPMGELLARADRVDKLTAVCVSCGSKNATRTQRVIVEVGDDANETRRPAHHEDPTILIGATEHYEARCRHCHDVPGRPDLLTNSDD